MRPYTSKVKPRKAAKTKKVKPIPPKGNPSSDAAKREKAAKTKKKSTAKKVAKKVVKATAKKTAVPIVTRGLIRAIPYIGAAVGGAALGVKALSEGFSRVTRGWKPQTEISEKTKRIQGFMTRTGVKPSPEMYIHGDRPTKLGKNVEVIVPEKKPYPSYAPDPDPDQTAKGKLGQQPEPGKSLRMLAEKKVGKTRGAPKPKPTTSRPERVDDYNYTPRKKSTKPKVVKKSTTLGLQKSSAPIWKAPRADLSEAGASTLRANQANYTKGNTDIKRKFDKDKFDKFRQDSSRGDRHLGAPKKKPLGMEGAFWDGSSWVL